MLKHEPRVADLIKLADGAGWLTPPTDIDIGAAIDAAAMVGSKGDLVAGLTATIELAERIISNVKDAT